MLYCVICIDENTQVCTATIVFRRHRWFRLIKNWAWFINHVAGDGASPSVLRMILICCNHVLNLISGGLLEAHLYPLKTGVSRGPPGLSGGPGPLGPPRNSTTAQMSHIMKQPIVPAPWCRRSPMRGRKVRGGATERGIGRRGQLGHGMAYISPQCEAFIHDDIRPFKHRSIHMYIGPAWKIIAVNGLSDNKLCEIIIILPHFNREELLALDKCITNR